MLKPGGTLSLAAGSLSAAAGIGGRAIGASLAAAAPSAGRPIKGEPGGRAGAAAGAGAAGMAGCCAAAARVNAPTKTPAANRRADETIMPSFSPVLESYSRGRRSFRPGWLQVGVRLYAGPR